MDNYYTVREFSKLRYIEEFKIENFKCRLSMSKYEAYSTIFNWFSRKLDDESTKVIVTDSGAVYNKNDINQTLLNISLGEETSLDLEIFKDLIINQYGFSEKDLKLNNNFIIVNNINSYVDVGIFYIYKIRLESHELDLITEEASKLLNQ